MTETIRTAMDRLMTTAAEPQDYVAEDGLLYCGTCNTPKEAFFPNGRPIAFPSRTRYFSAFPGLRRNARSGWSKMSILVAQK